MRLQNSTKIPSVNRQALPNAAFFDLLDAALYLQLSHNPHDLEALAGDRAADSWIVLDEIQKVSALLDEVYRLLETRRWRFKRHGNHLRWYASRSIQHCNAH